MISITTSLIDYVIEYASLHDGDYGKVNDALTLRISFEREHALKFFTSPISAMRIVTDITWKMLDPRVYTYIAYHDRIPVGLGMATAHHDGKFQIDTLTTIEGHEKALDPLVLMLIQTARELESEKIHINAHENIIRTLKDRYGFDGKDMYAELQVVQMSNSALEQQLALGATDDYLRSA